MLSSDANDRTTSQTGLASWVGSHVISISLLSFVCLQLASFVVLSDWPAPPYRVCGQRVWAAGLPFIAYFDSYGAYHEWYFSPIMFGVNALICIGLPAVFVVLHRHSVQQPVSFSLRALLAAMAGLATLFALASALGDFSREGMAHWWQLP